MKELLKGCYKLEVDFILKHFGVSEQGLKSEQVVNQAKIYGKNEIKEKKASSKAKIFFDQFKDLLVIILVIAAIISLFTGELESTIVIFSVISLNAIIGTYQYFKAEKSLKSLKKLASPYARVIRDSKEIQIKASEVVVGDILIVSPGDLIPADGRIIKETNFEVNESALTGEALTIEKHSEVILKENLSLADQHNMVFSGTVATNGAAIVVVTNIGMESELGKIAGLLSESKEHTTPLQKTLDEFSKKLAIIIIAICVVIFILSLYRKISLVDSLMFAVALAVAAIPEALGSIVTIVLAIGTSKMAEENAIIKDLKAVEGLGCVSVICSDKTGTLTQNKMQVNSVALNSITRKVNDFSIDLTCQTAKIFVQALTLCNDTNYLKVNATEVAIYDYASSFLPELKYDKSKYQRYESIPFDSKRKIMSTVNQVEDKIHLYVKGASEVILNKSINISINGKIRRLTAGDRFDIKQTIKELSLRGERCLAVGYKVLNEFYKNSKISYSDETDLTFLGIISLVDPPRMEARPAIEEANGAGIKTIMITGDHEITARGIAKEVGIIKKEDDEVITGKDLDKLNDYELSKRLDKIKVYARVSPVHKIRIVKSLKSKNEVVAFVGDGVNDGPAIKEANVGISMGKSGTEVAKDASSIILTDDNYYTIIKAVRNGRKIYNNIQNAITFLISGNAAGIFLVVYTSLFNLTLPFAPVHLLFINLLTDSLPAIAIGMEDANDDLLKRPPRKMTDSLLSKRIFKIIIFEGVLIALFTAYSYHLGLRESSYVARTMVFGTLCMARLFHSFNCRGSKSIFRNKVRNRLMITSFLVGMLLINLVLFARVLQPIFFTYKLTSNLIIMMFVNSIMPTVILQLILLIRSRRRKNK